jgi:hypothetical protein
LRIAYPVASRFKPNFVNELLDVYQGTIVITAFLAKATLGQVSALGASVTVQACTDAICLPPAELLGHVDTYRSHRTMAASVMTAR